MRIKSIVAVMACECLLWICVPPLFASDHRAQQFWTLDAIEYQITDRWKINTEAEFHFDDRFDLFNRQADISLSRKVRNWLSVSVNYRHVEERTDAEWERENRLHINTTFFGKIGVLTLADRIRVEYRNLPHAETMWRYRNKLRIGLPLPGAEIKLEPYAADEFFILGGGRGIDENRILAGIASRFRSHMKLEIYCMLKFSNDDLKWSQTKVIGANVQLAF